MRIHFRYEPERHGPWLGVKTNSRYKEFLLMSWMDVDDVIHILKTYENDLNGQS